MKIPSLVRSFAAAAIAISFFALQIGCGTDVAEPAGAGIAKKPIETPTATAESTETLVAETSAPESTAATTLTASQPAEDTSVETTAESTTAGSASSQPAETAAKADPKPPAEPPKFTNAYFEAPLRLMVDDQPLNSLAKQMYPSPAMYDVDNDGQQELIVGDIFGRLNVYENKNEGDGDPVWNKHYALKSADGENIKVSNW